jgi:hypothetical protein
MIFTLAILWPIKQVIAFMASNTADIIPSDTTVYNKVFGVYYSQIWRQLLHATLASLLMTKTLLDADDSWNAMLDTRAAATRFSDVR